MDKKLQSQLAQELEKKKNRLEKQLKVFAKKNPKVKGDWSTRFPNFGDQPDENAEEIATYESLLAVEQALEIRLEQIEKALKKIKTQKYGICEKCKKEIEPERLKVAPEAKFCIKCINSNNK